MRPTNQQLEALIEFLIQNPGVARGHLRSAQGKQDTKRKWNEMSISINALGGAQKSGKEWAKYWADKKCYLKKTCGQHAQSMRRTGGGPADDVSYLTPIEQRFVAVCGGPQFAAGDSHVAVNPFPSTSQIQEPIQYEIVESEEADRSQIELVESIEPSPSIQVAETVRVDSPAPRRERSPLRRPQRDTTRTGRTVLDQSRERFAAIEAQRVEAEINTARALSQAVDQMANLTAAIDRGAQSISDALNNIAAALQRNNNN